MNISILKKDTIQAWFPFGDDAEVLIQYVPREELQKMRNKARKISFQNHQKVEIFDSTEADKILGNIAVKDWNGFTSGGQPFPCTPENIGLLMTKWNEFSLFVNESCVSLEGFIQKEKEETEKNSLSTSGQG